MDHVRQKCCLAIVLFLMAGFTVAETLCGEQKDAVKQLSAMDGAQFQELLKRASVGEASAQALLGVAYLRGLKVERNEATALALFQRAAKKRHPIAENNLALMYFFGQGTPANYGEALKWFKRASDDGSNNARFNLGLMYHHGYGVKANLEEAAKWYEVAAIQGEVTAQNSIAFMYEHGQGVLQDVARAEMWYSKAAAQGLAMAQYNLGVLYLHQMKHQEAYEWFLKAAKQGHEEAAHNLAVLHLHGHCMPINYGEAYRWLKASKSTDDWSIKSLEMCKQHLSDKDLEQFAMADAH